MTAAIKSTIPYLNSASYENRMSLITLAIMFDCGESLCNNTDELHPEPERVPDWHRGPDEDPVDSMDQKQRIAQIFMAFHLFLTQDEAVVLNFVLPRCTPVTFFFLDQYCKKAHA